MKRSIIILISIFGISLAGAQQLNTFVEEALMNNPEVQAFKLKYSRASEKINEVNTLPNTQFGFGYFVSEPETRTGAQKAKLSVKQMLPWFGAITARKNYANAVADAEYQDIVIAQRKLVLSVTQSYYKLFAIRAKEEVLDENSQLLETYEQLALTSVEVGKASAVDVLRLQIRQNEIEQQKAVLEQDYLAEQSTINNLLNRNNSFKVEVDLNVTIPEKDPLVSKDSLEVHPELLKYDKLYESIEQSELLNQKESSPSLGLGIDYIAVAERSDVNPIDNGKDIVMPMVALSIPIFNKKYNSRTKQNELKQLEIQSLKENRLNMLKSLLEKAVKGRTSSKLKFQTQSKNLKRAKDAEDILIKSYETGTIDFNDVLDIQELQLKFQIDQIESIKMYYLQSTLINYLTN